MDGDLLTKSAIDIYRSLDTNGDGSLDKDEVRNSLAKFGYSDDEADKIITALDKGERPVATKSKTGFAVSLSH